MIPPLSLFNVSRYERRDTEKRVNKNVQMSALCHSALSGLSLSMAGDIEISHGHTWDQSSQYLAISHWRL